MPARSVQARDSPRGCIARPSMHDALDPPPFECEPNSSSLRAVLFVADGLHPVDGLALETFVNGDVRHRRRRRSAVPVLLSRREPDHVTRSDLLDRPSPALRATATRG